ncbi:MAG TPA: ferritin-like domain-containing protein [Thermoanaerobaculia bacterium]|jgi:hypothetical protein
MGCTPPKWTIHDLRQHLQYAVDLEFWTIPFYMSAMYSIKDPTDDAYRLIQSVVYEEMLHAELASNVANAFGHSPKFPAPAYEGTEIPHLNFNLDSPNPTEVYTPYSAEIGPLDEKRINSMCLIEYPEWDTGHQPDLQPKMSDYGSIGEFYDAVRVGAAELAEEQLRGGRNQVDLFRNFYRELAQTVTDDGRAGLAQALTIIAAITEQGEGQTEGDVDIQPEFRNTADGYHSDWPHFRKFTAIRDSGRFPATYAGVADPKPGSPGHAAQRTLIRNFTAFRKTLEALFSGGDLGAFGAQMATLGANVLTCWQQGAIPKFSQEGE